MNRRIVTALLTAGLVAAACGDDDASTTGDRPLTTVPAVTDAPADDTDETGPTDDGPVESTTTSAEEPEPAEDEPIEPAETTTTLPAGDPREASIELEVLGRFEQPIDAVVAPNGEWWLAERPGRILVVDPESGVAGDEILDLSSATQPTGERGLLGLAVDDEALYVNYTDLDGTTQVVAFPLDDAGRPVGEGVLLLAIEQPFSNHNGGSLAIGPDGHLYVGVGDGGSADDPLGAGQDPAQILGSVVRIDPTPFDPAAPYRIPADNPYADGGGVAEIFLIGVRNPWRFAFDPATDDFWIADVGQNAWEEVTLLLGANGWGRGTNLGWNLREGIESFRGDRPPDNVDPVFVYGRSGSPSGCSITGGEVYRGTAIPELHGAYLFGDYCTSELWAVTVAGGEVVFADLGVDVPDGELVDFATLPDGELVAMSLGGSVVRLRPA